MADIDQESAENFIDSDVDRLYLLVKEATKKLGLHFDCVRIFAQRYEGEETGVRNFSFGCGNQHAIDNQIRDYITDMDEQTRERARERYRDKG